jgi:hypothetical protein
MLGCWRVKELAVQRFKFWVFDDERLSLSIMTPVGYERMKRDLDFQ